MIHDDKPPLDEALLEHHGVKGMRWGVRKDYPSSSEIHGARTTVHRQKVELSKQRTKAVKSTIKRSPSAPQQRAKLKSMKKEFIKNPDRVTAIKMTKGEAAVHALLMMHPATAPAVASSMIAREVAARATQRQVNKANKP